MLFDERAQRAHERVEVGVADLGLVVLEVARVVVLDLRRELVAAGREIRGARRDVPDRRLPIGWTGAADSTKEKQRSRRTPRGTPTGERSSRRRSTGGQAPRVRRAATAWSCTRSASVPARRRARAACEGPCPTRPHAGVITARVRRSTGSQPAPGELAPDRGQSTPEELARIADRTVGRDRAPRDPPAAVEVAGDEATVVDQVFGDLERDQVRAGLEHHPAVASPADVHAGGSTHRGERAREQVDRGLAFDGTLRLAPHDETGLVEHEHGLGTGKAGRDQALEQRDPRLHDLGGPLERHRRSACRRRTTRCPV